MCDFRIIEKDFANDPQKCVCKGAVLTTYRALSKHGHDKALTAALRVYAYHHPDDTSEDGILTVERWIVSQSASFH